MTRLIGSAKARELYFLSEKVDAKHAERIGLARLLRAGQAARVPACRATWRERQRSSCRT